MEDLVWEVWILGYNEDDTVNDFEQLEATFEDSDKAKWFAENYDFSKPTNTPKAKVVVEEVISNTCINVLLEREL